MGWRFSLMLSSSVSWFSKILEPTASQRVFSCPHDCDSPFRQITVFSGKKKKSYNRTYLRELKHNNKKIHLWNRHSFPRGNTLPITGFNKTLLWLPFSISHLFSNSKKSQFRCGPLRFNSHVVGAQEAGSKAVYVGWGCPQWLPSLLTSDYPPNRLK